MFNPYKHKIYTILDGLPETVYTEYKFDESRKFRFDFAIPDKKIAIEYEGIYGGFRSRHTSVQGYSKDTEKYNLATISGWRILRYTASTVDSLETDISRILENDRKTN
jgi:very-short-patch-repair endonuclease